MLAAMTPRSIPPPTRPRRTAVGTRAAAAPLEPPPPPVALSEASHPAEPASVSFAPNGSPQSISRPTVPAWGAEGHALVGVGPGLSDASHRAGLMASYPFPI